MSRLPSSLTSSSSLFTRPRASAPRIRAELKPLGSTRLFTRPEPMLASHWAPERLARLHEPLTRYHD